MHRLIFYGLIILVVILLFSFIDFIIYRLLRLFLTRSTAQIANITVLVLLIGGISIISWWGHTHTRLQLNVTYTELSSPRLPSAFDGYRIAQISDLHLNSFDKEEGRRLLSQMADSMQEAQPDIIVFTGDLVTIRAVEAYPFAKQLEALSHIPTQDGRGYIPVYSILGNHDYADYVRDFTPQRRQQDLDSLISLQSEAGWNVLRNSAVTIQRIEKADSTVQQLALVGVENIGEPPFSVYGDLELAMASIGGIKATKNLYTILLSHNPTHWRKEVLPDTSIDLTLSGHTHATQILIGGWSPAKWKYDEWMGLYNEGSQYLYVNTGIGTVGPRVRIGIAPEVSIITLRNR